MENTIIDKLENLRLSFSDDLKLLELIYNALDNVINSVLITDGNGEIIWVNNGFTKNTGYTFDEVKGKKPSIMKSGIHDQAFYFTLWSTLKEGKVWTGKITNKYKDGSLVEESMIIVPVGVYYIAIKQICE